jgi:hypothetical protein
VEVKMPRTFAYIGDELGYLKCFDITNILKKSDFKKEETIYKDTQKTYTPNRCEGIEITAFVADSLRRSIFRRTLKP